MDLVSIVVPNYNKEKYLEKTLNSILFQTYKNWEAIIIDDGSTDNSIEIIKTFEKLDSRFLLIEKRKTLNGGSVNRNIGLKKAKGKYVIFFDSDDLLESPCLEERVNFMNQNNSLDFAVFPMGTFKSEIGDSSYTWIPEKEKALEKFLSHDLPWQTMQPVYKKEFLLKNEISFNEAFPRMQDVEFHTKILKKNPTFSISEGKPNCFFRINSERKVFKPIDFYYQWCLSIGRYHKTFFDESNKYYLAKTGLFGLSELIQAYYNKQVSKEKIWDLQKLIIENYKGYNKFILSLYLKSGLKISFHIPGHRFLFKTLLLFGK